MTTFAFIVVIIVLFLVLMVFETDDVASKLKSRQTSLWAWMVSGNWPAKVGSILLIIGIGALMRYALVNIDVPNQVKLSSGVIITAIFGYLSYLLRELPRRRALHLALAGATCGVAYLTAYSSYGLFGYLDNITGITLLVIVAGVTGAFAVASNAVSIAVLAMIGAYMAPAFGMKTDPGPVVVYSYYIAISILCLLMIVAKGWRSLIHLSFLFTLAGGLFLGWTSEYYHADFYHLMQPIILILVTLHLAMPIMEQQAHQGVWGKRFDLGYFIVLPVTAAVLTFVISPNIRPEFSIGLLALGLIWTVTAVLQLRKKAESTKYAIVAFLFYVAAAIASIENVSFSLFGIFCMTVILTASVRLKFPDGVRGAASFLLILFIGLWFIESGFDKVSGQTFNNTWFWEHVVVAFLIYWSAYLNRQKSEIYKATFYFISGAVLFHALMVEILRLQFIYIAEVIHLLLLASILFIFTNVVKASVRTMLFLTLGLILYANSWYVADDALDGIAFTFAILDVLVLTVVAYLFTRESCRNEKYAVATIAALPILIIPWALRLNELLGYNTAFFVLSVISAAALTGIIIASLFKWTTTTWQEYILPELFLIAAALLVWPLLFYIERGLWPVVFELTTFAIILVIAAGNQSAEKSEKVGVATVILAALILQAMLLRFYGPVGIMTIADISQIRYPTVISFIWVFLGGGIAWWGSRIASRIWWSTGSGLMVVAAIKLVFIDFGSLGELGNIIGLIGAGAVFMIVAWLVPIPPKKPTPPTVSKPEPTPAQDKPDTQGSHIAAERSSATTSEGINFKPANTGNQPKSDSIPYQTLSTTTSVDAQPAEDDPFFKPRVVIPIVLYLCIFIFLFWLAIDLTSPKPQKTKTNTYTPSENKYYTPKSNKDSDASGQAPAEKQEPVKLVNICTQFKEKLPSEYVLYAGGAYKGEELNFQIDQSGNVGSQFEVLVNEPGKNVVLALGAYEPSIWDIKWTQETTIAGVFISGYYEQQVIGISDYIPVLNSTYNNQSTCGHFYINPDDPHKADKVISKFFGKSAKTYYLASGGKIQMGQPLTSNQFWHQNEIVSIESFRVEGTPLAGKEGINQLINEGKLRPATPEDLKKWKQKNSHSTSHITISTIDGNYYTDSDEEFHIARALGSYVVLGPMRYPAGLYGAHSVTFIIPEGVPRPEGNPGHSAVYDMNTGACEGALCR